MLPEYRQAIDRLLESVRIQSHRRIVATSDRASILWDKALEKAAERGDHRPMRDLLIAAGVIEKQEREDRIQITIGVKVDSPVFLPANASVPISIPGLIGTEVPPPTKEPLDLSHLLTDKPTDK
jgi:hypothetical protein